MLIKGYTIYTQLAIRLLLLCLIINVIMLAPDVRAEPEQPGTCLAKTYFFLAEEDALQNPLSKPVVLELNISNTNQFNFSITWESLGVGDNLSIQSVVAGNPPQQVMLRQAPAIRASDLSPTGNWLAVSYVIVSHEPPKFENHLELMNLPTGKRGILYESAGDAIIEVAVLENDGLVLGAESLSNDLIMWDLHTGDIVDRVTLGLSPSIMTISPSGKWLAFGSGGDGIIEIWNLSQRSLYGTISTDFYHFLDIAFSGDESQVAAHSGDALYLWNMSNDFAELRLQERGYFEQTIVFHPTLPVLASGGFDGNIRLWDIESGEMITAFEAHEYELGEIYILKFNADGDWLFSVSGDFSIKVWDFRCILEKYG